MQSSSFYKVIIIYFFSESLVFETSLPKFILQNFLHHSVPAWTSYSKFLFYKPYVPPLFLEHLLERAWTFFSQCECLVRFTAYIHGADQTILALYAQSDLVHDVGFNLCVVLSVLGHAGLGCRIYVLFS